MEDLADQVGARMEDLATKVGASFWFIFVAYVCAFLPWSALANRDFLGPTWNTVRNARVAGRYNVAISIIPACYIVSYIIIQGASSEYTEMCAALVALVFSILHLLRSLWGLWQLRCFRSWAHKSIDGLHAMGVPYRLTTDCVKKADSTTTTAEIVDGLLVNESIVDNQVVHGKVRCFMKYANLTLRGGSTSDSPPSRCFKSLYQGFRILCCFLWDQASEVLGRGKRHRIEQVPFQPVEVWLNWSVPFVAQGLGSWMKEFNVPRHPSYSASKNSGISARERLDRRAEYFALQVLSSAWLQLWPELGLPSSREARSALHWDEWDETSKMGKGLISKRELLERAMSSGEALPFGAPHNEFWEKDSGMQGYGAYRRMLEQVVNELPVRKEFDAEVERFDIERLEWLTILLDLGSVAVRVKDKRGSLDRESSDRSTNFDPSEQDCTSDDAGYESSSGHSSILGRNDAAGYEFGNTKSSIPGPTDAASLYVTDVVPSQALENLRKQLNLERYSSEGDSSESSGSPLVMFQCMSVTGWWRSVSDDRSRGDWFKNENRHVMKVGEMIDAWMSLVGGDQISFMNEMNGSDFWDKMCCFAVDSKSGEGIVGDYLMEEGEGVQLMHAEVEKRRLYYDLANPMSSCEHLESFVTFMGYSMETVRSRLGMWVRDYKGVVSEDLFRPVLDTAGSVSVDLKRELSEVLIEEGGDVALRRRGVQTRVLWELQQGLAKAENNGPGCVSNIALCILSYPSVHIESEEEGIEGVEVEQDCHSVSVGFRDVFSFKIRAMGGPQRFEVRGKLWKRGQSVAVNMSVRSAEEEKRFEWELWRDAFLGRLMGLKDWQEGRGVQGVEVQNTMGRIDKGVHEIKARTGEKILFWAGWKPFRLGFVRFELESEGLLQQQSAQTLTQKLYQITAPSLGFEPRRQGQTTGTSRNVIYTSARINRVRTVPVEYAVASPEVLRHAYLLVEETLTTNEGMESTGPGDGVPSLMRRAQECLAETNDAERAFLLFETAANIDGSVEALESCIKILTDDVTISRAPGRVVDVMEHFIGKLVSDSWGQELKMSVVEADKIRQGCVEVIKRFGDVPQIRSRLLQVLESIFHLDPDEFMDWVVSGLQMMYCFSQDAEILLQLAQLLSTGVSESFHAKVYGAMGVKCMDAGGSWIGTELGKDISQFSIRLHRNVLSDSKRLLRSRAADSLAGVLWEGFNGVEAKPEEAVALYRRAIAEGDYVVAMNNLGLLLEKGADGVAAKPEEAESLYRRAIAEGRDLDAMNNLGMLLEDGADGVTAKPEEAESLYRQAIAEGGHVVAMNNLGLLLEDGADGVTAKPEEAESLYRRAIAEGGHVRAMLNLGCLLEDGADGVVAKPEEAESLYRRAIAEGRDVEAMYNLGRLLERRADGLERDMTEAVLLYDQAVSEGHDVHAMYRLALVLETGAEGVDADVGRAEKLYEQAGEHEDAKERLYALRERMGKEIDVLGRDKVK